MAKKLEATRTKPRKIWNLDIGDQIRDEELDGRKFVVVPMTMILEGVHTGSQGPVYYSLDELAKTPKMWNMKPVLIEHPFRGDTGTDLTVYKKQAVGMIMNTYFDSDEGKLKAEAWIDKDLAQNKYPSLLEHIEHRLPMEVSTGLFSELILEPGTWKGEEYKGRIVNIRADHLAILPHKQGACSLADGAGLLINESFEETAPTSGKEQLFVFTTVINEYPPGTPLVEGEAEEDEIEQQQVPKKPRLKNSPSEVAKMVKPIQTAEHPYELDTDQCKIIIIPKSSGLEFQQTATPQMPIANYSELDEEDKPIPEKTPEAIQDNAKVLSPTEQQAEAVEDMKTGGKARYIELRNKLAAALIRRHIRSAKNSKKKNSFRVRNEGEEQGYPSLALSEDAFTWKRPGKDLFFQAQRKLYDALVNHGRYNQFNDDQASLRFIIEQLSSLLLTTFPVSNLNKIRGLMEFAKSEPQDQAVFTPADINLVEHTIGQIDQAQKDSDRLSQAFREFKTTVRARGANDLFYSSPINFLTGAMKQAFSPINKEIRNDVKNFFTRCDRLNRTGTPKSDGSSDRLAMKLNITQEDTPEILEAKKNLGSAAIILGRYAEKGIQSSIHPKLLIGDSRNDMMRNTLSAIYSAISGIFTGKATKDEQRDQDPLFARWARSQSIFEDRYERCRQYAADLFSPTVPNSAKAKLRTALVRELKIIVGLRKDSAEEPSRYRGILGSVIRRYPQLEAERNLIAAYAKELVDMTVMKLEYDNALQQAQEQYNKALENIDALGLPDDVKEEFITLPEKLFDPTRQKNVAAAVRNADRLAKYLFRRDLSRIYGLTDSMDTALSREMLKVAGVIPSPLYERMDAWLAENRAEDPESNRLTDLVAALPDARSSAKAILSKDPDLIRELLGEYKASDDETLKKVDSFRNTHEFLTRDELLSKHSPEYRALNDEIYQFMKSLDGYDPNVGFTPEQRAYLYENGWYNDWFKANSSTRGYADYLKDWAENGDGNKDTKFDNFKPQQYMIDNLLAIMRKGMLDKQFPSDKLYERNVGLGEDIAREIQDAPTQSKLISDDWATNKYTASLGRYTLDEDGTQQMAADLEGDPVHTKVTLLYKAFKDQHIATKAYVLLDHLAMNEVGEPAEGEVPVANV